MKKNKFLFGKRVKSKSWAPDKWDIVGGHVKKNESLIDALKRETKEEINVTVLHATLLRKLTLTDNAGSFNYYIYMILSWKGKPVNNSYEHKKIKWLTRKKLGKKQLALDDYLTIVDCFFTTSSKL